ncbi:MAG: single-stranded DNA-binding protein [Chloroflexi bacterium]|nr:single-stranded DNA-binding protein [Chloroflexota bacterium]
MYQNTVVVGHLGRDPEMRYTPKGTPVTQFTMATTRKWTDAEGNPQEKTTWFRVSAWGRLAETCNQYLSKGRLVLVEGEIDASAWQGQDGQPRATLELRARNVKFLGGRGAEAAPGELAVGEVAEEEIPF